MQKLNAAPVWHSQMSCKARLATRTIPNGDDNHDDPRLRGGGWGWLGWLYIKSTVKERKDLPPESHRLAADMRPDRRLLELRETGEVIISKPRRETKGESRPVFLLLP